jgi:Pectate lyase superfamily protein
MAVGKLRILLCGVTLVTSSLFMAATLGGPARLVSASVSGQVVGTYASNATASSVSVALGSPVAAGEAVVVAVMVISPSSVTALHISDGADQYTTDVDVRNASKTNRLVIASAMNVSALSTGTQLTVSGLPASQGERVDVAAFDGLAAVDQHASGFNHNATSAPFATAATPTTKQSNELLFAAVGVARSTTSPAWDAGWAGLQTLKAHDDALRIATREVTQTGNFTASGTATGRWVAEVVSFKLQTAGPSPSPSPSTTPTPTPPPAPQSPCTASTCKTCNVVKAPYRADNTGQRDATLAIRQAIADCEASKGSPVPNVVWFPAGTYKLDLIDNTKNKTDLVVQGPHPVIFAGQGRIGDPYPTTIIEEVGVLNPLDCSYSLAMTKGCLNNERSCVPSSDPTKNTCFTKNLLSIQTGASGSRVQNISLDTRKYDAGTSLNVNADYVTVSHLSTAHKSAKGAGMPQFPIHYAGNGGSRTTPCATNPSTCHWGNVIDDLVAYDEECDDGIVLAMQGNLTVNRLRYEGSRVALYVDSNVHINHFDFTPGVQKCDKKQGFAQTSPADHIYISDYIDHNTASAGGAGFVGNSQAGHNYMTDTLAITGYELQGSFGDQLSVRNVNSFSIQPSSDVPCDFGPNNLLHFTPDTSIANPLVQGCTLTQTRLSMPASSTIQGGVSYVNDTFAKQPAQTYSFTDGGASTTLVVNWSGGRFKNCPNSQRYLTNASALNFKVPSGQSPPSGLPC